jgi:hypothetical protein
VQRPIEAVLSHGDVKEAEELLVNFQLHGSDFGHESRGGVTGEAVVLLRVPQVA